MVRYLPSTVNDEKWCRVCNYTIFKYCNKKYTADSVHARRHRLAYRAIDNQIKRMNTYDLQYSRYKHRKKSRLFDASTVYTVYSLPKNEGGVETNILAKVSNLTTDLQKRWI